MLSHQNITDLALIINYEQITDVTKIYINEFNHLKYTKE